MAIRCEPLAVDRGSARGGKRMKYDEGGRGGTWHAAGVVVANSGRERV